MRKSLIAAAVAGLVSLPSLVMAQAAAPASPHTFTGNVGLVSNYVFRGISQSAAKPAIQGGFDYSHASGLYAGTWASNVNWVADNYGAAGLPSASNSVEIDVYGGYRGTVTGDIGFDLGLITYNYPGTNTTVGGTFIKPDSTEVYGALSWKWLTVKYSHSTTALFGWNKFGGTVNDKTDGSGYLEINGAFDLGNGWGLSAHVGDQKIKGNGPASYTDYKLGVTKDAGYGVFGLAVTTSDSNGSCTAGAPTTAQDVYCWGTAPGKSTYDAGKSAVVLSFSKTF
ncbi:MAG: TorF family putative porin [Pseudomonadota bacterium]